MTVATINLTTFKIHFHHELELARSYADKHDELLIRKPSDLEELSGPQLVSLYNTICDDLNRKRGLGLEHVKRFSNKEVGIKRTMANIHDLWEVLREEAKFKGSKTQKATAAPRRGAGINLKPQKKVYPCREGSKQAILVEMLSRPQGATMSELLEALSGGAKPWKEVTVKSGLNWDMNKVKGYGIRTTKRGDDDCYHLVLPEGMKHPLPHLPRKKAEV